ncbi:RNA polymerase sigma factor [Dictyobacter aurantiacus]|uniref:RNA polymerase sigma factor n=1 Tax=Dictyobacter aurantiacus TaxID=1936993 RepID=A0A401ZIF3_9CHLR|nr:sigma-70 family RNA polymerase sigma factor [Dictyobacter aurantiacus]GCE06632.1 RNA polymerase sigma factor [Dictyobacter aurantiacus]
MEVSEHQLDRARQGDAEALSILYNRFLPGVFGYIATRVPDRSTAEDLTSEVFLQMVEDIHRLRAKDEQTFIAWLFSIARVVVAAYYRKREKQPVQVSLLPEFWEQEPEESLSKIESSSDTDPIRWVEMREDWHVVVQAINQLTEEQRQVLVGRLIMGYDVASVARIVGKKSNAVKALQFRALQRLQRILGKPFRPILSHTKKQKEVQ